MELPKIGDYYYYHSTSGDKLVRVTDVHPNGKWHISVRFEYGGREVLDTLSTFERDYSKKPQ